MPEGISPIPPELFQVSPEELKAEAELGDRGFIPERYKKIEEAEVGRMRSGLEQALQARTKNMDEQEVQKQRKTLKRYFGELMLSPSFENGPYAAKHWLNLHELLPRVLDIEQDERLVPDIDTRVPFHSFAFDKKAIIEGWIIQKTQAALKPEDALTDTHLNECFTNVSQLQLDTLITQTAQSGLTIFAESPQDRWRKLVRGA